MYGRVDGVEVPGPKRMMAYLVITFERNKTVVVLNYD